MRADNNTVPSYYARKIAYIPMTDYQFNEGDFGNIAANLLSFTPCNVTAIEQSVLGKILSRAVRFSKDNVLLPMKDLIEGVVSGDNVIDTPMHSAKTTIERAIKSLMDRGLIEYFLDTEAYPYVNRVIVHVQKIKEMLGMGKLNIGKKQRNTDTQNESRGVTRSESTNREYINREYKDKDQEIPSPPDLGSSVSMVKKEAERIKTRSRVKRKKVVSTSLPFTKTNFRKVWEAAEADFAQKHNIVATGLSNKMPGMMFQAYQGKTIFTSESWKDYICDVVEHWNEYRHHLKKHFRHQVPEYPTFNYFHKLHTRFLEVYREHRLKNVRSISSQDQKIENLEKEIQELRVRNKDLKLQTTSKTESYLDKVAGGNYKPQKQKSKQNIDTEFYEDEFGSNW